MGVKLVMARVFCARIVVVLLIVLQLNFINGRQNLNVLILLGLNIFMFATTVADVHLIDMLLDQKLVGNLPFSV